jgi:hypothetical protein
MMFTGLLRTFESIKRSKINAMAIGKATVEMAFEY